MAIHKKKRNKKYKAKTKAERYDYRTGGVVRAQYAEGDEVNPNVKQPRMTTTEAKFIPGQTSTRRGAKSTQPAPKAPPGYIQTVGGGFQKIIPNLNSGTLQTGIENKGVSAGKPISKAQEEFSKAQEELNEMNIAQQKARELAQTGQPAQPSLRMEKEAMNLATGKPYTPEEKRALDASIDQTDFERSTQAQQTAQAFQQAPTTGKGSDQMFIGREGDVRPQSNFDVQDKFRGRDERDERDERDTGPQIGDTKKGSGLFGKFITYVWNGNNWVIQQKEDKEPVTEDEFAGMTDEQKQALFESERGERTITSGRTAEQIAAGEIPEGIIPTAELQKVMERRPDETEEAYQARLAETQAEAVQIDPITGVKAVPVEAAPSQVVETMEAATIQTPEELQAAKVQAEQVAKTPDIEVAAGEVVEDALAKAAKVERVEPIEGVEVEIPEGALAERVVGTISEGAKATAALNAGTSLSRITRAKKQLSRAGLSNEDIEEIGNDPEALEDRLADFSEEQRGIIEGLPQEALVSTQMNNLLEGIESGKIPTWAKPAVAQVEQMLAKRGMSASTVGRDSLFNAIIQSAMPIAQSNAQAIQQSVSQQKTIEAQTAEANAQRVQQTALTNAQNVFNMDMAQFSADQQTSLSNSKFMQTVGLTNATNAQQAAIQNAVLMSQANLAEADFYQKAQINNANAFLQMDMQNLANEQQVNIVKAQQEQQRLLSNQAATNAARQFNAASENQTQQFMASLESQVNQFNVAQMNAATQFNVQSKNVAAAREADRIADVNKTNATILNQVNQFNAQLDYNRQQWNAANEQAVLNSNVQWRRQSNLADTAAQNAINQQNAQNAFGLSSSAQSFLWQELRDQADYDFRFAENDANRKLQAMIAAAGSEGDAAKNWSTNFNNASSTIDRLFGTG